MKDRPQSILRIKINQTDSVLPLLQLVWREHTHTERLSLVTMTLLAQLDSTLDSYSCAAFYTEV
jgi:hypothetical protein